MKKKKNTGAVFTVTAIAALVLGGQALDFNFGLGNGENKEIATNNDLETDNQDKDDTFQITPDAQITVTVAPAEPKVYDVIVDKNEIIYNNETISTVQSLIEIIRKDAGEEEFSVILHDETAIENTLEDIKNAFDKNGVAWTTAD